MDAGFAGKAERKSRPGSGFDETAREGWAHWAAAPFFLARAGESAATAVAMVEKLLPGLLEEIL
jgi:hypothetical protein